MKVAIYLCSLGPSFFKDMTYLCVTSLRRLGRYAGLIIVFTNNGYMAQDEDVHVVPISPALTLFDIREFKASARRYIDGRKFDAVVSMDTDMIAIRDIRPLLVYSGTRICGMQESPWTRMSDVSCSTCLTTRERRVARRRWGINAGLLCTPGTLYEEYMELWEAEIRANRDRLKIWINQPPFNALVLRGQVRFKAYPRRWIEMPPLYHLRNRIPRITADTRILHYCWQAKRLSLLEMELTLMQYGALD
jgi:hypothetical protein